MDASYSYGSFNTHKSNLSLGYTEKNGLVTLLNAYQNYSDNDYKVKTEYLDLKTDQLSSEKKWFKRFHDRYHNETIIGKIGLINKKWADRLIFDLTYSQENAQIQNANIMEIAFGGKSRKSKSITPSLSYEKKNLFLRNIDLNITVRYNQVKNNNIDTLARQYSWNEEYRPTTSKGEGDNTLAKYKGKTAYVVSSLKYRIAEKHFLSLYNTYSNYTRKTTNSAANADNSTAATFMHRKNEKDILGLSYKLMPNDKWNALGFTKYYYACTGSGECEPNDCIKI